MVAVLVCRRCVAFSLVEILLFAATSPLAMLWVCVCVRRCVCVFFWVWVWVGVSLPDGVRGGVLASSSSMGTKCEQLAHHGVGFLDLDFAVGGEGGRGGVLWLCSWLVPEVCKCWSCGCACTGG